MLNMNYLSASDRNWLKYSANAVTKLIFKLSPDKFSNFKNSKSISAKILALSRRKKKW